MDIQGRGSRKVFQSGRRGTHSNSGISSRLNGSGPWKTAKGRKMASNKRTGGIFMRSAASRRYPWFAPTGFALVSICVLVSGVWAQNPAPPPAAPQSSVGQSAAGQSQTPQTPQTPPAVDNPQAAPIEPSTSEPQPTAQEPTANDQGSMFVFKKQVQEVVLHATVFDDQRHLVPSLNQSAFTVLESGTPQTITSFRREDVPVAM
jgi:hypothetical protein